MSENNLMWLKELIKFQRVRVESNGEGMRRLIILNIMTARTEEEVLAQISVTRRSAGFTGSPK